MQAAMEVASESKKIMEKSQEIEHIKEYCCRSLVLSCSQLVGIVAKYIRVLSVVLFKGFSFLSFFFFSFHSFFLFYFFS